MAVIHLDTHVVARLYLRLDNKIAGKARTLIARSTDVRVSPLVMMELDTLLDLRRIKAVSADAVVSELDIKLGGLRQSPATFAEVVAAGRAIGWTRDPFDRLLVANAIADGARLVTADETILAHFKDAVWD